MKRFVLSPAATADVEAIEAFLDEHAPHATDAVLTGIRDAIRRVSVRPGLGHLREHLTDEPLRSYPVWSYLVVYRPSKPVEIVCVLHAARDAARELRRRR